MMFTIIAICIAPSFVSANEYNEEDEDFTSNTHYFDPPFRWMYMTYTLWVRMEWDPPFPWEIIDYEAQDLTSHKTYNVVITVLAITYLDTVSGTLICKAWIKGYYFESGIQTIKHRSEYDGYSSDGDGDFTEYDDW